mmetsp:Transcript_35320/g.113846  ORF Transcript_35320/g.113846 Transcript_35320/m.113846 type:complete len:322 (+) Transcript_35320:216-1181(+)
MAAGRCCGRMALGGTGERLLDRVLGVECVAIVVQKAHLPVAALALAQQHAARRAVHEHGRVQVPAGDKEARAIVESQHLMVRKHVLAQRRLVVDREEVGAALKLRPAPLPQIRHEVEAGVRQRPAEHREQGRGRAHVGAAVDKGVAGAAGRKGWPALLLHEALPPRNRGPFGAKDGRYRAARRRCHALRKGRVLIARAPLQALTRSARLVALSFGRRDDRAAGRVDDCVVRCDKVLECAATEDDVAVREDDNVDSGGGRDPAVHLPKLPQRAAAVRFMLQRNVVPVEAWLELKRRKQIKPIVGQDKVNLSSVACAVGGLGV